MGRGEGVSTPAPADGFEGEVAGLGLCDLLQLNAQSRFSGCFRIRNQGSLGLIFFRDGEVVHAEMDGRTGEEAFRAVLAWSAGRFSVEPNVVTARRTIHKSCEHLLLDAQRLVDEHRARTRQQEVAPVATPMPTSTAGPVRAVRAVPGVTEAVVLTRDGKRLGQDGYAAEVLAGQVTYLAMVGAEIGALFQAGELRYASVKGSRQHLLLFATRSHYLGVFARPDSEVGSVEAGIRSALSAGQ